MALNAQLGFYLLISYLVAAIPFGLIIGKIVSGADVRAKGSGNIGATNVARTIGKKWGVLVLFLDALKGYAVVMGAAHLGGFEFANLTALVAVLGHCFPVYLKFKGGKGVATSLGVVGALSWPLVGFLFVIFLAVVGLSRRISAGSLSAALAMPLIATFSHKYMWIPTAWAIAAVVWFKHRENIKRLLGGKEPRFF